MKLTKARAGYYTMTDHRGRKVEVFKTNTFRGNHDWELHVDGEKVGSFSRYKEAKTRALDLDKYLASKLLMLVANASHNLAMYVDWDEAQRLREREGAFAMAARALSSKGGLQDLERHYKQLNDRYRSVADEFSAAQDKRRKEEREAKEKTMALARRDRTRTLAKENS